MPDVGIQIPPNLSDWWLPLVRRGRDRPRRPVGQRRPHLARAPVPEPAPGAQAPRSRQGYALTERLCVYPQYIDPEWMAQGVLDTIKLKYWSFIPRRGSGRRADVPIRSDLVAGAIEKARDNQRADAGGADGAVRRAPARR